ncbi:hypothetical protein EDM80_15425 [bacterium]|nr:MAG: hypothetical protein EDM80_15425 [bacterium]RIK62764.1 MAG: hypothetical protein DCC64_09400 [Planctomycetota bacterium]
MELKHAPCLLLFVLALFGAACGFVGVNAWPDDHDNDREEAMDLPPQSALPGRFRARGDVPNTHDRGLPRGLVNMLPDTHLTFACERQDFFGDDHLALLAPLPRLRVVEVVDTPGLTPKGLTRLSEMPKLAGLTLLGAVSLSDAALEQIARAGHLEWLELGPCDNVSAGGVRKLAALKKLRTLVLYDARHLSAADVEALERERPQLQVFTRTR